MTKQRSRPSTPTIRCAIYTRKSTDEGLDLDFNSLDAQRESGEAYIKSQAHEGWVCLPDRYDDGGFSGGSMERPALQRLLADIEAGKVDCVVVYKVDRLSRSLLDFSKIMEAFDKQRVSFVSVTQQFNTTNSMGRLMLCYPIQKLDGIANRCAGQLYKGQRTHIGWTARDVALPSIADSPASGAVIKVAGITGRIRGMKWKRPDGRTVRPSLVVIDDPQTDESARSLSQCARNGASPTSRGSARSATSSSTRTTGKASSTLASP